MNSEGDRLSYSLITRLMVSDQWQVRENSCYRLNGVEKSCEPLERLYWRLAIGGKNVYTSFFQKAIPSEK